MAAIVECVPNFSEGRRKDVVDDIIQNGLSAGNGVTLLDMEMDADHNRSVVTFVGSPEALVEAAFRAIKRASEIIDMQTHKGEHPRMGATDVCPFVPISGLGMAECVALAKTLGERVGKELDIPVFLYEDAATRPERQNLADVRKGQYEGLRDMIGKDPDRTPDYGPNKMNLKAGCTAIGARMPLIAYNVYLNTPRVSIAKKIANAIRHARGGYRFCKAMGFEITERNQSQVSMNLVNYKKTPVHRVFQSIENEANRWGATATSSEIVGLIPAEALYMTAEHFLKLENFSSAQVLEEKLQSAQTEAAVESAWTKFADNVASSSPAPGGGSVSAAAGSLAAALAAMVCRLTIGKKKYADVKEKMEGILRDAEELRAELAAMVKSDAEAFNAVMAARKMPKDTDEEKAKRSMAIVEATKKAATVPLDVMAKSLQTLELAKTCAEYGNVNSVSDAGVAAMMAKTAVLGAGLNVKINLVGFEDTEFVSKTSTKAQELEDRATRLTEEVMKIVTTKIEG